MSIHSRLRFGQTLPWVRTAIPGAHEVLGGCKYDLDRWDESYFGRLRDYCNRAAAGGIIVEICLFNGMYADRWPFQAMFHANNSQGVGTCTWDMVQSLTGDPELVAYQAKYVAEITGRLNDLDNVLFHICDEPWMGRVSPDLVGPWLGRMIDAFEKTEADLPKKTSAGADRRLADEQQCRGFFRGRANSIHRYRILEGCRRSRERVCPSLFVPGPAPHPGAAGSFRHSYVVTPGSYKEIFSFRFPAGRYTAEWVDARTATVVGEESFAHEGGIRTLTAPEYSFDIALRVLSEA